MKSCYHALSALFMANSCQTKVFQNLDIFENSPLIVIFCMVLQKKYLNLEGHGNRITGSRVTAILLNNEFFLLEKVVKSVGGGSVINGAYPV